MHGVRSRVTAKGEAVERKRRSDGIGDRTDDDMNVATSLLEKIVGGVWWPAFLLALPVSVAAVLGSAAEPPSSGGPSASAAARDLVALVGERTRSQLLQPFTDEARSDWHYTPRSRTGVPWRDMSDPERQAARTLLRTALNAAGLDKVHAIMQLEIALRELESVNTSRRDPENYAIAIFGTPSPNQGPWGFRLEGHHLSLHFTVDRDRFISTLPQFMGSNPALVPHDIKGGPRAGTRVLAEEEDLARALMAALDGPRRSAAHFDSRTYGDIVTKNAARLSPLEPVGVKFGELAAPEQATLLRLINVFANLLRPELSEARLARVRSGGLDTIRFGWAGSLDRGQPFYYRIQGKTFLIELDNSGGNHIHTVWRDFESDWGRDVLGEHYAGAGKGHGHDAPRKLK
jgi:hypothetical protein